MRKRAAPPVDTPTLILDDPLAYGGLAGHPRGLTPLFFTELWERFSYYGMRSLLTLFMVLPAASGGLGYSIVKAGLVYGMYTMSVFLLALPGGYLGDNFFGARRTVLVGGIVIAIGHFTLALQSEATFLFGLVIIAIGTGLLKPNISSMVGSLYKPDDPRRDSGFSIFYVGVNIGALAPFVTGFLAQAAPFQHFLAAHGFNAEHSWHWGFASAGVGMTLGLVCYTIARGRLSHVGNPPPADRERPWGKMALIVAGTALFFGFVWVSDQDGFQWLRYSFLAVPSAAAIYCSLSADKTVRRFAAILVFTVASLIFWAIYEQAGTTISLFGDRLTRTSILGVNFPSSYYQVLNSSYVIVLSGVFAWLWLRLGDRQPSSPMKFTLGLAFVSLSFLMMVPAARLTAHGPVSPFWLFGVFFLQTLGELCLSPVGLSVMTKLAPERFMGLVLGVWFLGSALGNKLAGVLSGGFSTDNPEVLAHFFLTQAIWVAVATGVLFALSPWVKRLMGGVR